SLQRHRAAQKQKCYEKTASPPKIKNMNAAKRERFEQELIRQSNVRPQQKKKFKSVRQSGDDFIGLEERITELTEEHERWNVLRAHIESLPRTNIVIAEFLYVTRLVAENTLAKLRSSVHIPELKKMTRNAEHVAKFVAGIWLFGVHHSEPVNRKIDYLSWVTL